MKSDYFHKINTEEKAYWLGFILGDGNLQHFTSYRVTIDLKKSDSVHLTKFAKALDLDRKVTYYRNAARMVVHNKQLYNDLLALGLTPNKSLTAKWPKIPKKHEIHMLRGLFDADGSIYNQEHYLGTVCSNFSIVGTKHILENVKRVLKLDNRIRPLGNVWRVSRGGNPAVLKIYSKLYKKATVWLDRKRDRFIDYLKLADISVTAGAL